MNRLNACAGAVGGMVGLCGTSQFWIGQSSAVHHDFELHELQLPFTT